MQDRDWTGTAAAFIALAMTAGVWLWPQGERPAGAAPDHGRAVSLAEDRSAEEVKRWRAEARRWDGTTDGIQLSAASPVAAEPAILR